MRMIPSHRWPTLSFIIYPCVCVCGCSFLCSALGVCFSFNLFIYSLIYMNLDVWLQRCLDFLNIKIRLKTCFWAKSTCEIYDVCCLFLVQGKLRFHWTLRSLSCSQTDSNSSVGGVAASDGSEKKLSVCWKMLGWNPNPTVDGGPCKGQQSRRLQHHTSGATGVI